MFQLFVTVTEYGEDATYIHNTRYSQTRNGPSDIVTQRWYHYCHLYDGESYAIYKNGVQIFDIQFNTLLVIPMNGSLILGQEQDILSGGFDVNEILRGSLSLFTIFDKILSIKDIRDMTACKSNFMTSAFAIENLPFEIMNVSETLVSSEIFCEKENAIIFFSRIDTLAKSLDICRNTVGSIYVPTTEKENNALFVSSTMICDATLRPNIWLGISDQQEENVWRKFSDNSITNVTFFKHNYPNGHYTENCICMGPKTPNWNDIRCSMAWPSCIPCVTHNLSKPLRMGGLCVEYEKETFVITRGYKNKLPYFHGIYGFIIYIDSSHREWYLFDVDKGKKLAKLNLQYSETLYPIGRLKWTVISKFCNYRINSDIYLNLSPCEIQEYTCENMHCIPSEKFCNGVSDCIDSSDENNCRTLDVPEGYKFSRPPDTNDNTGPISMEADINVLRITSIDDEKNIISFEFDMELRWKDSRITFFNLHEDVLKNSLTKEDIESVWTPFFVYPTVYNGEIKTISQQMHVYKKGERRKLHFNSITAGKQLYNRKK